MPRYDRKRFWERPPPKQQPIKGWGVVQHSYYVTDETEDVLQGWNSFFNVRVVTTYHAAPYHQYATHYIEQEFSKEEAEALAAILNAGGNDV